jgi:hypothetical protein
MRSTMIKVLCMLMVYAFSLTSLLTAQQGSANASNNSLVNNRDIILMTRSKFDDATIVKTIQAFNTDIDVSVAALIELKNAGVTQPVIQAMLAKATDGGKTNRLEQPSSTAAPISGRSSSRLEEPTTNFGVTSTSPYPRSAPNHEKSEEARKPSQPRVYLESVSRGSNRNAARDQSMEMAKDFLKVCSEVKITINQSAADYTIRLNHIEHGLLYRDNQIEVFDRNGDLMRNKEGGSIKRNVQQACDLVHADYAQQAAN